jgi:hypothetical protein
MTAPCRAAPLARIGIAEGEGGAVIPPGLPVHGDGETFDEAINDALVALREYAGDCAPAVPPGSALRCRRRNGPAPAL